VENHRWELNEAILLVLSAPGTFLMILPINKISGSFAPSMWIRACLLLSGARLLRVVPILKTHQTLLFSSKLFRRLERELCWQEILGIILFFITSILPFSTFQAMRANTNLDT
jgi:hypothetical protein